MCYHFTQNELEKTFTEMPTKMFKNKKDYYMVCGNCGEKWTRETLEWQKLPDKTMCPKCGCWEGIVVKIINHLGETIISPEEIRKETVV